MPLNPNIDISDGGLGNDNGGGGGAIDVTSGSEEITTTPDSFADYSSYDSVMLDITNSSPYYYGSYLGTNTAITKKNIVGADGELTINVRCWKKNADEDGYFLAHTDSFTLDQWIEKSTGKQLNNGETAWESGGTSANGFGTTFSSGDENGTSSAGNLTITFSLVCKVKGNEYRNASTNLIVLVQGSWYTDDTAVFIKLRPLYVQKDTYALIDGKKTMLAKVGDYYLIPANTTAEEELAFSGTGTLVVSVLVNKTNGELHFICSDVEIYGIIRKVVYAGDSIPTDQPCGEVVLFLDYIPPVDGESNIEVLYPCYVSSNAGKINRCHIAKLFGNANAKNRLFVSGNPEIYNCDWRTSAFNGEDEKSSNGDFTYFGDMDHCFYGQTDNAVMGYDIVATNKMVVLKSKSKIEPTNYFRSSKMINAIDASGNAVYGIDGSVLQQEAFPLDTGNIGIGAMNYKSVVNLNGDTLYLSSENTICGLDITGQVGDSQRISYSRSRFIDPELKELDLSDAVLWTDNSYVFLFASEATYVSHYETFDSKSGQYEWFKLDVKGVRCAAEIDDEILLGTQEGKIYRFEKGKFSDCDKLFIAQGGLLADYQKITYESALSSSIDESAQLTLRPRFSSLENSVFYTVARMLDETSDGFDILIHHDHNTLRIIAIDSNGDYNAENHQVLIEDLAYNGWFYFNKPYGCDDVVMNDGSEFDDYYTPYKLVPSETYIDEYEVYDENSNRVDLEALAQADLCRALGGDYEITDLDKTNSTFKLRENGRYLNLALYADQTELTLSFKAEIHMHKPVKSYFIAAPAVLGDISYRKTVWAWTLTAFKEANDLQVCQATNEKNLEDMKAIAFADSIPIGFDFKNFSFKAIDFEKSAVPRKYTYFRPLSVPFMSFGFKSDQDANSILTAASIIYTVPMLGRGNE